MTARLAIRALGPAQQLCDAYAELDGGEAIVRLVEAIESAQSDIPRIIRHRPHPGP